MADDKILAVAGFLAGQDCKILQIETQKWNAFTLQFLSRRDLQIVEPCLKPKTAKFCRPSQRVIIDGFYYRVRFKVLCEWGGSVAFSWTKNGALRF